MNNMLWMSRLTFGIALLAQMGATQASAPMWTFTPLTATTIAVPAAGSATVQYLVTNQSLNTLTLSFRSSAPGISQTTIGHGLCAVPFTLAYQQSCVLSLDITGSALLGHVFGGPQICQLGTELQCYQPSATNALDITQI
jgi:hypothetical protein